MAKKQAGKNSRAARQAALNPTDEIEVVEEPIEDSKTRVLNSLAVKELREKKPENSIPSEMDELTAITRGIHPDQRKQSPGKIMKQGKKSKKDKRKAEKAEMIKDMLSEKIDVAKKRHKTVRHYRDDSDDETKL